MAVEGLPHPLLLSTIADMDTVTIGGDEIRLTYVFFTWCGMILLTLMGLKLRKSIKLVPGKFQSAFEAGIDGLENLIIQTMGEKGRKFVPLLIGIFMYVLSMNLLGLVPGFDAPTANINTTVAIALFVFIFYNYIGIKSWGKDYIKHFTGPNKALIPLMFPIEIISHLARPLSMSLRLFGNIFGEEMTLLIFFGMGASIYVGALVGTGPMYFLFLLGKTIQAFILFMLTMIYIKDAMEHAH